ncbi:hypothetical protein MEQU1_002062 [Malassezia equina]|uniref:LAA1-like C-terminal TPR repeats domain-containing protein n=1 Tax=Malassezia equina TaxID=1381935 RepID=A0AAF0EFC7_9BASI|nr:hypothetical protein MEQU1_002062 [Malassezia equina]
MTDADDVRTPDAPLEEHLAGMKVEESPTVPTEEPVPSTQDESLSSEAQRTQVLPAAEAPAAMTDPVEEAPAPMGDRTESTPRPADVGAPTAQVPLRMPLLPDASEWDDAVAQDRVDTFLPTWLTRVETLLQEGEMRGVASLVDVLLYLCGALRLAPDQPGAPSATWHTAQPGRSVRALLARCLVHIYRTNAPKPPLYDVLAALHESCAHEPSPAHLVPQLAALHVTRALVQAHASAAGLQASLASVCVRLVKGSHAVLLRFYALELLQAVLHAGLASFSPAMIKDVLKTLRTGLTDPAEPIVRATAACVGTLFRVHEPLQTPAELETWITLATKSMHACGAPTRTSLAELGAALLALEARAPATDGKKPAPTPLLDESTVKRLLQTALLHAPTWQARAGALQLYAAYVDMQDIAWLEMHWEDLIEHATQLATLTSDAYVRLALRRFLHAQALRFSEPAQARAAAALGTRILAWWPPATPTAAPPSDAALVLALDIATAMAARLGELAPPLYDALYEPHVRLLSHPTLAVQARAAWWLRTACDVQPPLLAPTYAELLKYLGRDTQALAAAQHDGGVALRARLRGHSLALAALAPVAAQQPLYVRHDDIAAAFQLALDLLERGNEPVLPTAGAAIQAAWALVGSFMALGPAFLRPHLQTLLRAWRHALAERALPADLDEPAWLFLCQVRDGALASLHAFFLHGGAQLLTPETARRLVVLQSHALTFLDAWAATERRTMPDATTPLVRTHMPLLRTRVLRCCTQLATQAALEPLAPRLLTLAIEVLVCAERYPGSGAQAAIHASAGLAPPPWTAHDGTAFGVTSLIEPDSGTVKLDAQRENGAFLPATFRAGRAPVELGRQLDGDGHTPVLGALEHDVSVLYACVLPPSDNYRGPSAAPAPVPPATADVDAAVELIAALFPSQARDLQMGAAEFLLHSTRRAPLDAAPPGRRTAVLANAVAALLGAARVAAQGTRRARGWANDRVNTAVRALAQAALLHGDPVLHGPAAELYGYVALLAGSASLTAQAQWLLEQVLDPRHADARAACALALGAVYARVGGLHASPLTPTVSRLLLSLARDPHPAVHTRALQALAHVMEAAGVAFEPFASSTLGLVAHLCASASHEPEGGSAGSANLRTQWAALPALARVLSALVGVLGPDLLEAPTKRSLIYALLLYLARDAGDAAAAEAIVGLQRLGLVVPPLLETRISANLLHEALERGTVYAPLAHAAAGAYVQMAQRGTAWLAQHGGPPLLVGLLARLDRDPSLHGVRTLVQVWVRDTASTRPCAWVDMACRTWTALDAPDAPDATRGGEADEAAAALAPAAVSRGAPGWRTQLFLLQCLHEVLQLAGHGPAALLHTGPQADACDPRSLSHRVGDLIQLTCSASTATHRAVRLQGLRVVRDVLAFWRDTRDPEWAEARLLAQYEAPLAAALAAAFGADSSPDVLAEALAVGAEGLGAGLDVAPTSRLVRRMHEAWEQAQNEDMPQLGELRIAPGATAYLKLAVLAAWAHIALAPACAALVAPHVGTLAHAWATALTAYAILRADASAALDEAASLLLPTRADSALRPLQQAHVLAAFAPTWATLLQALTSVCDAHEEVARATLAPAQDEPTRTFLALYGLAVETLCQEDAEASARAVMGRALPVLVNAKYSGAFLLHPTAFDELIRVVHRVLMYEAPALQGAALGIVRTLVHSMRERLLEQEDGRIDDAEMPSTPLGHLWRMLLAFARRLPDAHAAPTSERASLFRATWRVLLDMVEVCGAALQLDLLAMLFHTLVEYARREDDAAYLLTPMLPLLRDMSTRACTAAQAHPPTAHRVVQGFLSAMVEMADALRARAGDMVTRRTGHALVSLMLVLTSLDERILVSSEVLERYAFLLAGQLRDEHDAPMALQCISAIAQAAHARPWHALHVLLGSTTPALVACAVRHATHRDMALLTLLALVPTMPAAQALALVLPVVAHAARPSAEGAPPTLPCAAEVVKLARTHAEAFRSVTATLPLDAREHLHAALRTAMGVEAGPTRARGEQRISLKTFGRP